LREILDEKAVEPVKNMPTELRDCEETIEIGGGG
jgi:hypothetical protein